VRVHDLHEIVVLEAEVDRIQVALAVELGEERPSICSLGRPLSMYRSLRTRDSAATTLLVRPISRVTRSTAFSAISLKRSFASASTVSLNLPITT
jgi:hypothetical protein